MLGDIKSEGEVKIGASVNIGYLPQLLTFDNPKESLLSYVENSTMLKEEGARRLLAKFEFYQDKTKP